MKLKYKQTNESISKSHGSPVYSKLWELVGQNLETGRDMAYIVKDSYFEIVRKEWERVLE